MKLTRRYTAFFVLINLSKEIKESNDIKKMIYERGIAYPRLHWNNMEEEFYKLFKKYNEKSGKVNQELSLIMLGLGLHSLQDHYSHTKYTRSHPDKTDNINYDHVQVKGKHVFKKVKGKTDYAKYYNNNRLRKTVKATYRYLARANKVLGNETNELFTKAKIKSVYSDIF